MSHITPPEYRRRVTARHSDEQITQQDFGPICDIHNILERFKKKGVLDHVAQFEGTYGNFLDFPDFQEAQFRIKEAEEMFLTVPAKIRQMHDNEPGKFIDWVTDPANYEEIAALGFSTDHLPEPPAPQEPPAPPAGDDDD